MSKLGLSKVAAFAGESARFAAQDSLRATVGDSGCRQPGEDDPMHERRSGSALGTFQEQGVS